MGERELRRQCRRLLQHLGIRPPLDVVELCRRIGQRRGRPIRLVPHALPVPGPFGVWIASGAADYVFYQRETSTVHQHHIILHELGHLLAGHRGDEQDDSMLAAVYPDWQSNEPNPRNPSPDSEVIGRALYRTCYDSEREREAETVATIILEWASVLDRVALRSSTTRATRRIETALGDRLGWL